MIQGIHQQSARKANSMLNVDIHPYDVSFSNLTILDRFNLEIKQNEMYSENSFMLGEILYEMATGKIVNVGMLSGIREAMQRV